MTVRHSQKVRADICTLLSATTFPDCVIDCYDGAQPANPNTAPTGNRIGQITLNGDPFAHGAAANGLQFDATALDGSMIITSGENWKFKSERAGTVRYGRIKGNAVDDDSTSTTLPRVDFSIGSTNGFDLVLTKTTYTAAGETADVTAFSYTQPIGA